MTIDLLKRALWFLLFVLAQAVVLGRIHLFGCATPLLYVWFVILMPRNYPKWGGLLWSFLLGLSIDIFFNTPGMAAASLTLIGLIQPYFLELFISRESPENLVPSMKTVGPMRYSYYVAAMVLLYCLTFYTLELFSFVNWMLWLKSVVGSTLVTLALIFTFETVRNK
ncbi:MAG: rod shape-determining protein MreD [Prevotella sp.]|nr:rod shape-determining protein MreD [Prevotella sp.]